MKVTQGAFAHVTALQHGVNTGRRQVDSDVQSRQVGDHLRRQWPQRRHPVANGRSGTGEIDHQSAAGDPGQPPGETGVGATGGKARGTQRFGDPQDLTVQHRTGGLRCDVARGDAGATDRHDQIDAADPRA